MEDFFIFLGVGSRKGAKVKCKSRKGDFPLRLLCDISASFAVKENIISFF